MALPLLEIPPQTPPAEVDEEILEIFTEEVQEVLETIVNSFDGWRRNPSSKDDAQTLRRAFHTLKGSGRLIGATVIGELGWRFESLLNKIMDGTLPRNTEVLNLIGKVEGILPDLITQFQQGEEPNYATRLLISQADHLTTSKGQSLGDFAGPGAAEAKAAPAKAEPAAAPPAKAAAPAQAAPPPKPATPPEAPKAPQQETPKAPPKAAQAAEPAAAHAVAPVAAKVPPKPATPPPKPAAPPAPASEEHDEEELDPVLMGIFHNEAKTHLDQVKKFLLNGRRNPPCMATSEVVRALHTLNGSSRSVNLPGIAALAAPMEAYMRGCMEHKQEVKNEVLALIVESGKLLEAYISGKRDAKNASQSTALAAAWQKLVASLPPHETSAIHLQRHPVEAPKAPKETAKLAPTPPAKETPKPPVVEAKPVAAKPAAKVEMPKKSGEMATEAADEFMDIFLEEAEEILETSQSLVGRWLASPNSLPLIKELQRELHTLKGGARMVGITVMGDLSHHLESVLTRLAEGNAQSNPRLQSLVQESLDELAAMLEAVRSGVIIEPATALIEQINASLSGGQGEAPPPPKKAPPTDAAKKSAPTQADEQAAAEATAAEAAAAPAGESDKAAADTGEAAGADAEERVRVRATLIDKLTNLAGEMSILRAHLEQQQGAFKLSLVEMEQTVFRLRDQLRRLEIETEAQMTSHFRQPGMGPDREEFDPLEMDRFSGMQQLSRSLMESVSDLLSIQDAMKNLIRHNDSLLIQQSRIGAELQDGIMRTRMVPFSQISPRLQRIARLTSKELHKKVDFLISDESMEFERTVLNRIVAPLEHLLRNAIGHGVEMPDERTQKGKPANATVRIDLFKEGAELILRLSDDGAGLNMQAIRDKAIERGMIQRDTPVTDAQLAQFILEPAFSTAKTITQVSGRGVGMDIVNSEVKQLGGTLLIFSTRGKGTTFEIRLPMSLTISMALLVHLGEETLAVPLHNVDAVMRLPRQDVTTASNEEARYYRYMENEYRIFHLGEMLGFGRSSIDANLLPVLLVHSVDQRVAMVVDGIEGSREVVVKSVGAQLSIIRWIAGATILGDGRVVIILDVLTLIRAYAGTAAHLTLTMPGSEENLPIPGPVVKTILVVDDSITVRKVTARLLKRQGLDVMTAKDGVDAVSQLQDRIPDLMLLDVEMPRMDGYELATQVRNDDRLRHIPIIMITSRTGVKHRERAEKIGVNRYLGKPFNETELLENISSLLAENK